MLRKIFYLLPPSWRHTLRWIVYFPQDIFSAKNPLSPPARLIYTGRGDFIKQGKEWLELFIKLASLKPSDTVLDIGSGIGRIALPLTHFLNAPYEGFDAVQSGVDWCTENITSRYPHFKFHYFPLHNDLYNRSELNASQFVFPYNQHEFDFACAISVFTHMLPAEVENYFSQMARVLKPGARAVCTFFILNAESIPSMNKQKGGFKFILSDHKPYALLNEKVKAANVAFRENYLEKVLDDHSFNIISKIPGHWCGREKYHNLAFQDIWIVNKK